MAILVRLHRSHLTQTQYKYTFSFFVVNLGSFLPNDACISDRVRQELSNKYLLAKFGFDTAENESLTFATTVVRQSDRLN